MAASIAHELNQPLTAVVTHAYACREWLSSQPVNTVKAASTAEKIVQESTRASAVVSRVRALFRKDAQVRESADMNRVIQDLVRVLRDEAIRREIPIRLILSADLPQAEDGPDPDSAGSAQPGDERDGGDGANRRAARARHSIGNAR